MVLDTRNIIIGELQLGMVIDDFVQFLKNDIQLYAFLLHDMLRAKIVDLGGVLLRVLGRWNAAGKLCLVISALKLYILLQQ